MAANTMSLVAPQQARSRRTLNALVAAAEDLLRERALGEISIAEICSAANVTTGAFYARFVSKDALMPFIYERYQDWLANAAPRRFSTIEWDKLDFEQAGEHVARILMRFYEERPWFLRAVALFARTRGVPPDAAGKQEILLAEIARAFEPHLQGDASDAIRFASFALITAAREAILFDRAPVATATLRGAVLARDLGLLVTGYLRAAGVTRPIEGKKV